MKPMRGSREFDCCECRRHVIVVAGPMPEPPICAHCLFAPAWFDDPQLRALIDPTWSPPEKRVEATL